MFGKKRTREEVEEYVSSILLPGETVEALHIEMFEPSIDFAVVTSHRLIVTALAGGGGLLVRSMPFDRIASVSVTNDRDRPLDSSNATGVVVYPLGDADHHVLSAAQQPDSLLAIYDALLRKLCEVGSPVAA